MSHLALTRSITCSIYHKQSTVSLTFVIREEKETKMENLTFEEGGVYLRELGE